MAEGLLSLDNCIRFVKSDFIALSSVRMLNNGIELNIVLSGKSIHYGHTEIICAYFYSLKFAISLTLSCNFSSIPFKSLC